MTTLPLRPIGNGPATHAFVIGVGAFPSAKPGGGGIKDLRNVPDLPSAADSAMFMCDWLIKNQDNLAAKLGSLEVLISDPGTAKSRYAWKNPHPVDSATEDNVLKAGQQWLDRIGPNDIALFYCCGHGAMLSSQPVLFLEDLNADKKNPWKHLNVGMLARSLRQMPQIKQAFFFSDTCGEFLTKFQFASAQDCRFFTAPDPFQTGSDKVLLLCAAPESLLAHEGYVPGSNGIKMGRFTQVLIQALSGSSARLQGNKCYVDPNGLISDIKTLRRIYFPDWNDKPFEPSPVLYPNEIKPIIYHATAEIPVLVMTDPENAMSNFDLCISTNNGPNPPWICSRQTRSTEVWKAQVQAGKYWLYALAINGATHYWSDFTPDQPRFELSVSVP